ncbi:unnamed protein product [Plutella xylostella]|uniref:(diamondback moth) hypothetical protein n=1 Tax=Plutella xylostella TaxID=51655 RepID=A0A8S4FSF7_PLUXY|nr:unnamed protein product [Plutella xylostella]
MWEIVNRLTGDAFVYRDGWGGISLMFASNQTTRTLMANTTFTLTANGYS